MPNFFALYRKGTKHGEADVANAVPLTTVDEEICALLGEKPDPKYYVRGWVDSIGWMLAVNGLKLHEIRKALTLPCEFVPVRREDPTYGLLSDRICIVHTKGKEGTPNLASMSPKACSNAWHDGEPDERCRELVPILDYLLEHFETSAWARIGKS